MQDMCLTHHPPQGVRSAQSSNHQRHRLGCGVLLLLAGLAGCAYEHTAEGLPSGAGASRRMPAGRPALGMPIVVPRSEFLVVPFAVLLERPEKGGWGPSFSPSYSSGSGTGVSYYASEAYSGFKAARKVYWNNALFVDTKTGRGHLLLDRRAVICDFYHPSEGQPNNGGKSDYLLFAISDSDTNRDGYINENDAVSLLMTDLAGRSPVRLTPQGAQLLGVSSDAAASALYVQIRRDSDGDGHFTESDESVPLRVDPAKPAEGTALVPADLRDQAYRVVSGSPGPR